VNVVNVVNIVVVVVVVSKTKGLTVGSLMLPQCIAVAILATLDPIYGLYTALVFEL
jgi:hypothetical protein